MLKLATFEHLPRFVGALDYHVVNPSADYFSECKTVFIQVFRSEKCSNSAIHKVSIELLEGRFVVEFTKSFGIGVVLALKVLLAISNFSLLVLKLPLLLLENMCLET